MDILDLHRSGLSQRAIARKLGLSRNTVKKYIERPEQGFKNPEKNKRQSVLDPYHGMIKAWLDEDEYYTGTWIYDRLVNQGYTGSYETVKRKVSTMKKQRQKIAYMRFETNPGHQGQVDFGEFQVQLPDGNTRKLYLFSMILGYSRKIYTEFIERCDMPHFLDCHIHAFEYFGGIPNHILYDRMKNVYIARLAGKDKFNTTLVGFSLHYGFIPKVAPAYAAWVKGKVERPYTFIREGFWRGYSHVDTFSANRDLAEWITKKDERVHGTTHEKISVRFDREQPHLNPLPIQEFDTSYRIYRKVYKDCTVHFEGNVYVLPHTLVGEQVILRFKTDILRIFKNDYLIISYQIPQGKGHLVQDERFYADLKKDKEMNRRKYHSGRRGKGRAKMTISPQAPRYDMDVEVRSILDYDALIPEVGL